MSHPSDAQSMYVVIDGLEGDMARVEQPDGTVEDWPVHRLPQGVREGDVLRLEVRGGHSVLQRDHAETRWRRQEAQTKLNALNQTSSDGEVTL
ncbi:DUF3006 domain-containing protein [Deinococcus sp. HMF7604]|uniref:DUF3006 domain-containing protein n=1 Tax=Deinococcus betulae TaxID=2873312 RepID=UPI001CC98EC1|nr:DUF3006 domain-containing protein [Deinococcus betulae]MBZ9753494.1 DUF3006 domain-containing protein [Deinococcus betulae]